MTVRWQDVRHVLLDMDGTVLDLAFDNHFWRELVPQRYGAARGIGAEAAWRELEPHFRSLQGRLEWYCLDHWSALTELDLAALTREIRHRIAPLQGSERFLEAVRDSGRALWLATNAHRDSWMVKMEQTGLGGHFERIVCSHDFAAPKESPEFWQRFVARHPFEPAQALFVDDSLPVLRAARDFGIGQCVAIRHPDSSRPAREISEFPAVDRLADLLPVTPLP
ncbi:MAG TPA: GMP/IMP nucleotidase [Candidatus Binatia bacterium]|nr:GMP/IMP nucleotidase [Candidatus Binatia bacterium]